MEIWKDIIGFEGIYSISNMGRVRREKIGISTYPGKIISLIIGARGYVQISLMKNSQKYNFKVHKLVAEAFIGPKPTRFEINHKDGIKSNNAVFNLEYVTRQGNMQHAVKNGLAAISHGMYNNMSKLNDIKIIQIRRKYIDGNYTQKELGKEYGVTQGAIGHIVHNRRWKHVLVESQGEGLNHGH